MQINIGQPKNEEVQNNSSQRGRVTISLNPVRQRIFIDVDGNEYDSINPRTRKLIKRADQK